MPEVGDSPPPPQVGDAIYVPSQLYMGHGRDDFEGGLVRVTNVTTDHDINGVLRYWVEIEERPGSVYNWTHLGPEQAELRRRYGNNRGHPDPDNRTEFNDD